MANGNAPIWGMLLGAGSSGGVTSAVRAFSDHATVDKFASVIGVAAGAAVGAALLLSKKTRDIGKYTLYASAIFGAPRVIEDLAMRPTQAKRTEAVKEAAGALRAGDAAGAAAALGDAFGVTVAERLVGAVHAGLLGVSSDAPVDVMGVTEVERASREVPYSGAGDIEVNGNTGTMFGAVPIAGS